MQRFMLLTLLSLWLLLAVSSTVYADPILPLPRMPIGGDQDGSETPFVLRAPGFDLVADVQNFRVPGSGEVEIAFDFVFREAGYNNEFGFFRVDTPFGEINGLNPNDAGYLAAALERAQIVFPSGSTAYSADVTKTVTGGDILVFFIVQNNTLSNLRANNPANDLQKSPIAFFSLDALNPDKFDHFVGFRNETDNITQFGFEDLTYGGDKDYDDIVYNIQTVLQPSPPVEGRSVVFIKGIDSVGDCGNAEQWIADYLNSDEGKSLFGRAKISKYINFSYADGEAYTCPRTEPAYLEEDTCDGVANAATELQALIEKEATTDKATIMAHSMGGLVTAYLVATQPDWARSHVASVITFDSPLRGVREIATWAKEWATIVQGECTFNPDPATQQSSLADLSDTSVVVQTAATAATIVPFYPLDATRLNVIFQVVARNRTRLDNSRAFQIAQTCGGPFAVPEPDCQPPLSVADNHSQVWNRQSDGDGRNKALFVGCAVINALDCTFLQARVTPANGVQSALDPNQLEVEVGAGTNRMRFTTFYSGAVRMALTDPNGNHFGPDGAGKIAGYAVDDVSEIYELTDLVSGTWTIDLTAVDVPAEGVHVSLATAVIEREPSTINAAPIANAGDAYAADIGETVTFNGIESFDADGSIVLYEWDFESDGTIDFSSTESYAFHTYSGGFVGAVTLHVTDDDGATASGSSPVRVQWVIYMPLISR